MIAAAQVIFDVSRRPTDLAGILAHLQKTLPFACGLTEWRGYTTVIPQIRVDTRVPLTIQIEDHPEYVREEIQEMVTAAESILSSGDVEKLRRCQTRLDIMSVNPPRIEEPDQTISVYAETNINPADDDVRSVLFTLADFLDGYVFDCVNGKWLRRD